MNQAVTDQALYNDTISNTTAHYQYHEATGELKILISGSIRRVLDSASLVNGLLKESRDPAQEASS